MSTAATAPADDCQVRPVLNPQPLDLRQDMDAACKACVLLPSSKHCVTEAVLGAGIDESLATLSEPHTCAGTGAATGWLSPSMLNISAAAAGAAVAAAGEGPSRSSRPPNAPGAAPRPASPDKESPGVGPPVVDTRPTTAAAASRPPSKSTRSSPAAAGAGAAAPKPAADVGIAPPVDAAGVVAPLLSVGSSMAGIRSSSCSTSSISTRQGASAINNHLLSRGSLTAVAVVVGHSMLHA